MIISSPNLLFSKSPNTLEIDSLKSRSAVFCMYFSSKPHDNDNVGLEGLFHRDLANPG